jgi:hypothetical protein
MHYPKLRAQRVNSLPDILWRHLEAFCFRSHYRFGRHAQALVVVLVERAGVVD